MQASVRIIETLNELLTLELTAVNQYFLHSKMCDNWGYSKLAAKLREIAFQEMRDTEQIIDRILLFEGVPNLQRLNAVTIGENVSEQLSLALGTEQSAIRMLTSGIGVCDEEGDEGTREFFATSLPDEEAHVDWLETQIGLIEQLGEQLYLASQV